MDSPVVWILIAVLAIGGVVSFVLVQRSKRPKEEPVYHFHCASCKRKLKYTARQAGHAGMCPQCKKPLKFPAIPVKRP